MVKSLMIACVSEKLDRLSRLLPPEHRIAAQKLVSDVMVHQVIVEGPLLPEWDGKGDVVRGALILTCTEGPEQRTLIFTGHFDIRRADGARCPTASWHIKTVTVEEAQRARSHGDLLAN